MVDAHNVKIGVMEKGFFMYNSFSVDDINVAHCGAWYNENGILEQNYINLNSVFLLYV